MAYLFKTRGKDGKQHSRWRFQYTDWRGNRRTASGTASKPETEKLAARVQAQQEEIRKGYRPQPKAIDKHASRPFGEVVEEYLSWGKSQGGRGGRPWSKRHAALRRSLLIWWHKHLGLETLSELDCILPAVEGALRELQDAGKSGKTIENHSEALKSLCNWCVARGYLAENPLKNLARFDTTPETTRRAMTREEIGRLLEVAPEHRRLLYGVAFTTGLRGGELRALTIDNLDIRRGGLQLDAVWTKNRKAGFQPLPSVLLESLQVFADGGEAIKFYRQSFKRANRKLRIPQNPLLYAPSHLARAMDKDLKAAGIPKHTPAGKLDFHACRVAYVSFVIEAGASVKEAQSLARHSTPNLTLNTYGRAQEQRLSELTEAVGNGVLHNGNTAATQREIPALVTVCNTRDYDDKVAGSNPVAPTTYLVRDRHHRQRQAYFFFAFSFVSKSFSTFSRSQRWTNELTVPSG